MSPRPHSREVILDAAQAVVLGVGAAHLTLDAVAERAGMSKGGLIYNFPTKEALLQAMVSRLLQRFVEQQARALEGLPAPSKNELRASVLAALAADDDFKRISTALLAAAANNPNLLDPVRDYYRQWFAQLRDSGLKFEKAAMISFAVQGLWFLELFRLSPLSPEERQGVIAELLRLTEEDTRALKKLV